MGGASHTVEIGAPDIVSCGPCQNAEPAVASTPPSGRVYRRPQQEIGEIRRLGSSCVGR
jgi:hypothetical protein